MKHLEDKTLWDLVTGELVENAVTPVLEHLKICHKCRQEHEVISLIHQESLHVSGEQPSMRFSKSVMEKIEVEISLDKSLQYWMIFTKYSIIGGLFVAVLSCLIVLGSNNTFILNQLDHLDSVIYILIFTCIASWIFFIFDRILFSIFINKP